MVCYGISEVVNLGCLLGFRALGRNPAGGKKIKNRKNAKKFTPFSIGNQKVWASCTFSSPFQGFLPGLPVWSLEEDPQ